MRRLAEKRAERKTDDGTQNEKESESENVAVEG